MRIKLQHPVSGTGEQVVEFAGLVSATVLTVRLSTGRLVQVWYSDLARVDA